MPDFSLGEWLPDQPQIALPGLITCDNVVPTARGYESHPGTSEVASRAALAASVRGAASGETQTGVRYIIAGTGRDTANSIEPKLMLSWGSTPSDWIDVTPSSALSTFTDQGQWEFTRYGKYLLAVANGVVPQVLDVSSTPTDGGTNFSDLAADCSKAGTAAVFKNFLILGNLIGRGTNASAIGTRENAIHWSGIGDPTSWPTVGTAAAVNAQSDYQVLDGSGGAVTAIVPGGEYCAIFQERAIWRLDYVGGANVFSLRLIEPNIGCMSQRYAVAANNLIYFASAQGFMVFDGAQVRSIGSEKVDRTWIESFDVNNTKHAAATYNPENHCIYWTIPDGANAATRLFGYQYELNRWFQIAGTGDSFEWIFSAFADPIGGSLDFAPYSTMKMDSASGSDPTTLQNMNLDTLGTEVGRASLAFFNSSHKLKLFNLQSSPLEGTIETGDFEAPGGARAIVNWIRPIFEGDSVFSIQSSGRNSPNDTLDLRSMSERAAVGAWSASRGNRVGGRYLRAKFMTGAGELRSFSGFDADFKAGGATR